MFRFVRHVTSYEGFIAGSSSRIPRALYQMPKRCRVSGMGASKVANALVHGCPEGEVRSPFGRGLQGALNALWSWSRTRKSWSIPILTQLRCFRMAGSKGRAKSPFGPGCRGWDTLLPLVQNAQVWLRCIGGTMPVAQMTSMVRAPHISLSEDGDIRRISLGRPRGVCGGRDVPSARWAWYYHAHLVLKPNCPLAL